MSEWDASFGFAWRYLRYALLFGVVVLALGIVGVAKCSRAHAETAPRSFVLLIVRACLTAAPDTCVEPTFLMGTMTSEEQCRHAAPALLPKIAADHPNFSIKAYACVRMRKDLAI